MKIYMIPIFAALLALGVSAQQHQHGASATQPQNGQHQTQGSATDLNAMDTRLNEKLSAMDAASGEARMDAMSAVIDELLSQRQQMREMITPMGPNMHSQMPATMAPMSGRMPMGRCGTARHMMH